MLNEKPNDNAAQTAGEETSKLKQENDTLSQQVKRLIKAEGKLYAYQEELDAQLKEYKELYELTRRLNTTFDIQRIFEYTVEYIIRNLEYERVLIFEEREQEGRYTVCAFDGYYDEKEKSSVISFSFSTSDRLLDLISQGDEYIIHAAGSEQYALAEYCSKLRMDEFLIYPLGVHKRPHALLIVGNTNEKATFYRRVVENEGALIGIGNLVGLLSSAIENQSSYIAMKKALEYERVAEAKYRTLVDNLTVGVYRTSFDGRFLQVNPAMAKIFGHDTAGQLMETPVSEIYQNPDDRTLFFEKIRSNGTAKNVEIAMKKKDGTPIWTSLSVTAQFDKQGEIQYVDGILEDITERKQTEEVLRKAHEELEARVAERTCELSNANEEIRQRHAETSILYKVSSVISQTIRMEELLTEVLNTLAGFDLFMIEKGIIFVIEGDRMKPLAHVGHSKAFMDVHKDMKIGDCLCGAAAQTGEIIVSPNSTKDARHTSVSLDLPPHGHLIIPLKTKDRVEGVLDLYLPVDAVIDDSKIRLMQAIGNQLGIAIQNARLYEATKSLSLHDSLTGLWNHEEIHRILDTELARADREGTSVAVIMADLDHFKKVNDTYGHIAGDTVLRVTAERMRSLVRPYDAVGRYGGEEFLIVLPGCDAKHVTAVAERFRKRIGSERINTPEGMIPITVSMGIAASDKTKKWNMNTLVRAADSALYRAKENGRNRVAFALDDE